MNRTWIDGWVWGWMNRWTYVHAAKAKLKRNSGAFYVYSVSWAFLDFYHYHIFMSKTRINDWGQIWEFFLLKKTLAKNKNFLIMSGRCPDVMHFLT